MATSTGSTGLVWFRRDLRLDDNPAWAAATERHDRVMAFFVLEPDLIDTAGSFRRDLLFAHLHALNESLIALGGRLVVRTGPASKAVPQALEDSRCEALYFNADVTPYAQRRDAAVRSAVNVPVMCTDGGTVHPPGSILTKKGTVSQVFTPFYKVWRGVELGPEAAEGDAEVVALPSEPIPEPSGELPHAPGEDGAWDRLRAWLDSVEDYPTTHDLPAIDGTSGLSADLKFGTISPRRVVEVVGTTTPGAEAFVRQIAWRDWWAHTLAIHPSLPDEPLRAAYGEIAWRNDRTDFRRWCDGMTGYPIVDAGMRQLRDTGWMHNRVRMICASFLVKDLLIDWRWGERFFRHHLIDADVAQNAGNWQWVAGTGPDAAPYFRIFNPTAQAKKFDPRGDYIRRWVPELAALRPPEIFAPPPTMQGTFALEPSDTAAYPAPIVDHGAARKLTLAAYKAALSA